MTYLLILSILTLFTACEKVIEVKVNDAIGKLVIEGKINDQTSHQEIRLSNNIALTSTGTSTPVTGGLVTVLDDAQNEYLFQEAGNGRYISRAFIGIPGRKYHLKVKVDDQLYTAESKMPQVVTLDSIAIEKSNIGNKERQKIKVFYKDPIEQKNSYRFIVFINSQQTRDIFVANDDFNNGNEVSYSILPDDDVEIKPGDDISVEMQCIDNNLYNYWFTLLQQSNGANITPSNPPTNILPRALGYFTAHSMTRKSLRVID